MTPSAEAFRDLHRPGDPFVLANAWDAGTARMLAALGAVAVATSSAAHTFTLARPDGGNVARDEALAHARALAAAVAVPVSADLESGFDDAPQGVAETIRMAAAAGLAGASIEDIDHAAGAPYAFDLSVARVEAAAEASGDMVLTARADGVMTGGYDLGEAVRRIRAFAEAGADCLYVPFPGDAAALSRIVAASDRPVNALAAGPLARLSLAEFAEIGVARVSLGSTLARVAHGAVLDAARAALAGDFGGLDRGAPGSEIDALLAAGAPV